MPLATKIPILAVVALLGGFGAAYAPLPTLAAAGATFVAGLWSATRGTPAPNRTIRPAVAEPRAGETHGAWTTRLVSGFLLLWWLASVFPILVYSPRDVTGAAETTVGGSLHYQALLIAFGCAGLLFLPRALKRIDPVLRWAAVLWGVHLLWISVTLLWSIYPPLTFRNAVAFMLVSVGSFGLGAGFYGWLPNGRGLFLKHVFAAGILSALALLLPLPLHWRSYALLNPSERLDIGGNFPAFVVNPVMCALLLLIGTAIVGARAWRTRDWLWIAFLVLPLLVLKSRGAVLFAAVALIALYFLCKGGARHRMRQAGLLLATGAIAYAGYSGGTYGFLVPYLTRGSVETTTTLTGRLPLWEVLIPEIQEHPWLGVGFAAFWNPDSYPRLEQLAGFSVVSAHNGFLDMLLSSGVLGLTILLTFCVCTMIMAVRKARRHDPLGWLVFLFLTFYVLQNLTSSDFTEFYEITLIVVLAMVGLMASTTGGQEATRRREGHGNTPEPPLAPPSRSYPRRPGLARTRTAVSDSGKNLRERFG